MTDDTSGKPAKRSLFRKSSLVVGNRDRACCFLMNILFPDLDLSMEDRVALIRVEGVILDAQSTIGGVEAVR